MPRHALQLRAGEPVGPLRGLRIRRVQARGGGPLPRVLGAHGRPGAHLPLPQPLRQVVPPALQLRRCHLLRRHRQRPPLHRERPVGGAGAAIHRRPGRRDAGRAARQGAPLRLRGARARRGRWFLLRPRDRREVPGRDRLPARQLPRQPRDAVGA